MGLNDYTGIAFMTLLLASAPAFIATFSMLFLHVQVILAQVAGFGVFALTVTLLLVFVVLPTKYISDISGFCTFHLWLERRKEDPRLTFDDFLLRYRTGKHGEMMARVSQPSLSDRSCLVLLDG